MEQEKIFVNHLSDKMLILKLYKDLTQLISEKNKKQNQTT